MKTKRKRYNKERRERTLRNKYDMLMNKKEKARLAWLMLD